MLWTLALLIVPPLSLKASATSGKEYYNLQFERIYFNFKTTQTEKQNSTIIVLSFKDLGLFPLFAFLFVSFFVLTWYLAYLYKWKAVIICAVGDGFKTIKLYTLCVAYCLWPTSCETQSYVTEVIELKETFSIHCSFSSYYHFTRWTSATLFNTFILPQKIVHENLGSIERSHMNSNYYFKYSGP